MYTKTMAERRREIESDMAAAYMRCIKYVDEKAIFWYAATLWNFKYVNICDIMCRTYR